MAQLRCFSADWARVAIPKVLLFVAVLSGLGTMWLSQEAVVAAYRDADPVMVDIRLSGVDLAYERAHIGSSPYHVAVAEDSGATPIEVRHDPGPAPDEPEPVPLLGGTARLKGVVNGPDGAVAGATVRIERHTVEGLASEDLTADGSGRWSLNRVLGGRYRVRAWHEDGFAADGAELLFLAEHETYTAELVVVPFEIEPQLSFADAGDVYVGLTGTVAVTVTSRSIGEDGLIVVSGVPGAVVGLAATDGVTVTPEVVTADTDGVARFQVRCRRPGVFDAIATHQADELAVTLPRCVPQPPPDTAPAPSDDPADGGTDTQEVPGA